MDTKQDNPSQIQGTTDFYSFIYVFHQMTLTVSTTPSKPSYYFDEFPP